MDKIENEQDEQSSIKLLTPGAGDVFSNVNKSKRFKNRTALFDFLSMSNAVAGQFRLGYKDGVPIWELVYISEDN